MKKHYAFPALICLLCLTVLTLSSCLAGAQNDAETAGERDGISFCYLKERGMLLLSGSGALKKSSRILSLPFCKDVRFVYVGKGITLAEDGAFASIEGLSRVYFEGTPSYDPEKTVRAGTGVQTGFDAIETASDEEYGGPIGHCPVHALGVCLLCGESYEYVYDEELHCLLKRNGKAVCGETLTLDGLSRTFDENGHLRADGFQTLGGDTKYFENGSYVLGTRDIDGVRYTFSSEGVLTGSRLLDESVPAYQIVLPLFAILLGAAAAFGVYRLYLYRVGKEDAAKSGDETEERSS